ncbi:hypothetical protein ACFW04_013072 [Cataglyphis niger]
MSVSKFGASLKEHGDDVGRLRPAIESLRSYVRDNALCASSADEYDAKERKIRRLASPKEDTDATSKSYVDLALRAARKDEIEHRENAEKIASQLRKDADEAGQSVVLLFTRLAQLESVLGKRLDVAESSLSRRLDAAESSILSINNTIKYTLLPSPPHTLPRREKTEESKESEKPNEKSRIELASRLTKESNELEKRIQDLEKTASPFSNKASPNLPVLIQAPSMSDEKGKRP